MHFKDSTKPWLLRCWFHFKSLQVYCHTKVKKVDSILKHCSVFWKMVQSNVKYFWCGVQLNLSTNYVTLSRLYSLNLIFVAQIRQTDGKTAVKHWSVLRQRVDSSSTAVIWVHYSWILSVWERGLLLYMFNSLENVTIVWLHWFYVGLQCSFPTL